MKDNFSNGSDRYARYRPTYPDALYAYIIDIVKHRKRAWDCGTGNGQVAHRLCDHFEKVFATDISSSQLAQAIANERITYSVQPAETTDFPDGYFDLIVVAQAIHWFDFNRFYAEVYRTLRKDGLIVVIGYGRLVITPEIDSIISDFYFNIIGPYWDAERSYINQKYATIPFPFHELPAPHLESAFNWEFEHLVGYLETWSAVKHYQLQRGEDPIQQIIAELKTAWGSAAARKVRFPLLVRIGKLEEWTD